MSDDYEKHPQGVSDVATGGKMITPADDTDIANGNGNYPTALYLDTAGAFSYIDMWGNQVDVPLLAAGYLPFRGKQIRATGTDTTSIFSLWQDNPEAP